MDNSTLRQKHGNTSLLKPKTRMGFLWFSFATLLASLSYFLVTQGGWYWFFGQFFLAWALVLFFVVMHECGHNSFFKSRKLNSFFGFVAGILSMIPFKAWQCIHWDHHVHTGYRDLDPTTVSTIQANVTATQRTFMNFCWRFWIPIFSLVYRVENFWNVKKLSKLYPKQLKRMCLEMIVVAVFWISIVLIYGIWPFIKDFGVAFFAAFVVQELVMLSQHSHIPWDLANGSQVTVKPFSQQGAYTRSAIASPLVSKFLFIHFDHHGAHHLYPQVPGYFLHKVNFIGENTVSFFQWVVKSKRMPADVLIYQNSNSTGQRI